MGKIFTIGAHRKGRGFFAQASQEDSSVWRAARRLAIQADAPAKLQTQLANAEMKRRLMVDWQNTGAHSWLTQCPAGTCVETSICNLDRGILQMGIVIGFTEPEISWAFQSLFLGASVKVSASKIPKTAASSGETPVTEKIAG